ncbi:hypothetical protein KUTeg_021578 [Tegillarca granosa]|uniref:DNA 3'-5' helicase n=1 Tax=Tegillarca granosa TaxID=220873 RepID=A0ABQ9E6W2_TEGGR|nr:hypothetical protein KUTeg_021578 [Tegillarca granosa]
MAAAMQYAFSIFGGHDRAVTDVVQSDLQKQVPRFRLVFTTSVIGMGFDPPSIKHIIHMKPPRNLNNYFQEIGRAGRRGQISKATLYYCNADISKNLPGITDDIISYCKSDLSY